MPEQKPAQMSSPEDQMMQWITAKWITKPLYVMAELGIADLMGAGPRRVDALAKATGTHTPTLFRVLRALSAVGVFIETEERVFDLTEEGVLIDRIERENLKVLNEGSLTVALDSELTEELIQEGMVRDLMRGIQNLRKEMNLEVTDRIELSLFGSEQARGAVQANEDMLKSETLAVSWKWGEQKEAVEIDCGRESCFVSLKKAADSG